MAVASYGYRVRSVHDGVGAFVAVADGINGRVPSAEARRARLATGVWVEVDVIGVDPGLWRIGLRLRRVLPGRGHSR